MVFMGGVSVSEFGEEEGGRDYYGGGARKGRRYRTEKKGVGRNMDGRK